MCCAFTEFDGSKQTLGASVAVEINVRSDDPERCQFGTVEGDSSGPLTMALVNRLPSFDADSRATNDAMVRTKDFPSNVVVEM